MRRISLYALLAIGLLFMAGGLAMVARGAMDGWLVLAFFGFCSAVAVWQLWPWLLEPPPALSIEEMLARYPGPVELRMDVRKMIFALVAALVFGSCLLWTLLTFPLGWVPATLLWICLPFLVLGITALPVTLLHGSSLRLEADWFVVSHGSKRWSVPWRAATGFAVTRLPPADAPLVVYDDEAHFRTPLARLSVGLTGRTSSLPDNYGLPHGELAVLMAFWRERAVGGDHIDPEDSPHA